ncbi:MAG: hypothetical protein P4L53_19985 [Candidatus Obscuribacterales bacterium]|nr:hypothetical protein [Candidatus Obscuribacterales bacterium]
MKNQQEQLGQAVVGSLAAHQIALVQLQWSWISCCNVSMKRAPHCQIVGHPYELVISLVRTFAGD